MAAVDLSDSFIKGWSFGSNVMGGVMTGKAKKQFYDLEERLQAGINSTTANHGTELDKFIAQGGAIPDPNNPGQEMPNPEMMDLMAASEELEKIFQGARDPDWVNSARKVWADKLTAGQNKFLSQAMLSAQSGDYQAVATNMNRAMSLIPNGAKNQVTVDKNGELLVSGYDAITGEPLDSQKMTLQDVFEHIKALQDPEQGYALQVKALEQAAERRDKLHEQTDKDKQRTEAERSNRADEAAARRRNAISAEGNEIARDEQVLKYSLGVPAGPRTALDKTKDVLAVRDAVGKMLERSSDRSNDADWEDYGLSFDDMLNMITHLTLAKGQDANAAFAGIQQLYRAAAQKGPQSKEASDLAQILRASQQTSGVPALDVGE